MKAQWVYLRSEAYPDGVILKKGKVRISPDDRGFLFADGAYEVIRSYSGKLFLPEKHIARFRHSLDALRIPFSDTASMAGIIRELAVRNDLEHSDALVYVQVTRGTWPRILGFPATPLIPTVYVEVSRFVPPTNEMAHGIAAITVPDSRWTRCDIKWLGLLPNVLARQQATEAGAAEAIFVREGLVTEGSHSTIFGVIRGTVVTHPLDHNVLPGITREIVLKLCSRLGVQVSETPIPETRVLDLDEMFLACTTGEVTPIIRVNGQRIGNGQPGLVTRRLQEAFRAYVADVLALPNSH